MECPVCSNRTVVKANERLFYSNYRMIQCSGDSSPSLFRPLRWRIRCSRNNPHSRMYRCPRGPSCLWNFNRNFNSKVHMQISFLCLWILSLLRSLVVVPYSEYCTTILDLFEGLTRSCRWNFSGIVHVLPSTHASANRWELWLRAEM